MKTAKAFILLGLALCTSSVSAQTRNYNVNIYKDPLPLLEYRPLGGETYQRYLDFLERSSNSSSSFDRHLEQMRQEQQMFDLEVERMMIEGSKVVSDEVKVFSGINLATKSAVSVKARVVKRKSGPIEISCMGIKKGDVWQSCTKPVVSLQTMYEAATSDKEKSVILGLMDYGQYLLDTDKEVLLLK